MDFTSYKHIFMTGVGGMGMMPLAVYLSQAGCQVSGFDDDLRPEARRILLQNGISLLEEPQIDEICDLLVYSSAVKSDHPALKQARERGIDCIRRGAMLAGIISEKKLIAIVGSHGKTTTAGMLIHALNKVGFDSGYLLGAIFQDDSLLPARYSESEWLVAEVDESDGTIDLFEPFITVLVNIDWDHPDRYKTEDAIHRTFGAFCDKTRGHVFYPETGLPESCFARLKANTHNYSFGHVAQADFQYRLQCVNGTELELDLEGFFPAMKTRVRARGEFNAHNAAAALSVVRHLTGSIHESHLGDFPGIRRRQGILFDDMGLTVLEDYAHHPAEVKALLDYTRSQYSDRQIVTVFQPHRFTRTAFYGSEFARILGKCRHLFLLDVYAASEKPVTGGRSEDIIQLLPNKMSVTGVSHFTDLLSELKEMVKLPTVILFIGAGDIEDWASRFKNHLHEACAEQFVFRSLKQRCKSDESVLRLHERIGNKTTIGIGGQATWYAEPADEEDLCGILEFTHRIGIPVYFLGRGSNVLVSDDGYRGLVIRLNGPAWRKTELLDDVHGLFHVRAGVRLKELCARACTLGFSGFEFLEGIPGSLGGALRMNAGAAGSWIFDVVKQIRLVDHRGVIHVLNRDAIKAEYRYCHELKHAVAIDALLQSPSRQSVEGIRGKMEELARIRKESQPREPSAGCIFKNPVGDHAGKIIDQCGLKGHRVGDAEVSTVHANFIVNRGSAKSADVVELIRQIRARVNSEKGIDLQPEVLLMGQKWSELL